jgi:DNA invertase Pin-like site-specific DNA recombinase
MTYIPASFEDSSTEPLKENLDLDPIAKNNVANKVLIAIFSMLAELERDFISERTKEGLRARVAKGIKLGKPKGVIQASMYDKDKLPNCMLLHEFREIE